MVADRVHRAATTVASWVRRGSRGDAVPLGDTHELERPARRTRLVRLGLAVALVAEDLGEAFAKRSLRLQAARQPAIQHWLSQVLAPFLVEQVGDGDEVQDIIADRDASLAAPLPDRKDAERQVLDRIIAALRALDPAIGHGSLAFGKPVHAWS